MDELIPGAAEIDRFLASALRGESAEWPSAWRSDAACDRVLERIAYHGIAGLLHERAATLAPWPAPVREKIREIAIGRSMWELRHKIVLGRLIERLAASGVDALLLKGTAMAYDLYGSPAARERGDTDLLVEEANRADARRALADCGFSRDTEGQDRREELRSQEGWSATADDWTSHSIDLHWRPLNAPALDALLGFAELAAAVRTLPRLGEGALAPSRAMMLLHACLHRGLHDCAPYFIGGETYFGGNRLIWLYDLALLGRAMSGEEWRAFCRAVAAKRVADICLDGLAAAEGRFGPFSPSFVHDELRSAKSGTYFRSRQFGRALQDMLAIPGLRSKWRYARSRSLPGAEFMRGKYPEMAAKPLAALYARRFVELVRHRPGRPA